MDIANTILQQLGGNQLMAFTGAHSLMALDNGLQFSFRGCKAANKCLIVLEQDDTYSVSFYRLRGMQCLRVGETQTGVQAGELQRVFTEATGLDCTL